MKKFLLSFLLLITLPFACQKSTKKSPQTLRLSLLYDPPTLDPRKSGDNVSHFILNQCFEGLMRKDLKGELKPALATHFDLSDDGLHYLFYLRESTWSNGEPLTAYDFERTWKSTLDPATASPCAEEFFILKNGKDAYLNKCSLDAVGVKALDKTRLQVDLEHPAPYFIKLLAHTLFAPVSSPFDPSISNGPFQLIYWKQFDRIELKKNPSYWDQSKVKLDAVHIFIIDDTQTTRNLFDSGQIDWLGYPLNSIPLDALPDFKKNPALKYIPHCCTYFYLFNTDVYPLNNVKLRKALTRALNRTEIVQNISQKGETPTFRLVPSALWKEIDPPTPHPVTEDPKELFNQALDEMGITAAQLPPLTLSYNTLELNHKVAQAIQQQWESTLGIRVALQNKEWKVYLGDVYSANYQIARMSRYSITEDPMQYLEIFHKDQSGGSSGNWSHPQFSQLIETAHHTSDPKKRLHLLKEAEDLLLFEMPLAPIYTQSGIYLSKPYVRDVFISELSEMDLKHAYIEN